MAMMSKPWYREQARAVLKKHFLEVRGETMDQLAAEVKDDTDVSCGTSPGGWVQVWLWVPDPKTEEANAKAQPQSEP